MSPFGARFRVLCARGILGSATDTEWATSSSNDLPPLSTYIMLCGGAGRARARGVHSFHHSACFSHIPPPVHVGKAYEEG